MVCSIDPENRQDPPQRETQQSANRDPPKLQFNVFVLTAEFFRVTRIDQAPLDLQNQFGGQDDKRPGTVPDRNPVAEPPDSLVAPPVIPARGVHIGAGNPAGTTALCHHA